MDDLVANYGYSQIDATAFAQSAIRPAVLAQMMEVTVDNRNVNERRYSLLNRAIQTMSAAFIAIGVEAVFLVILMMKGILA